MEQNIKTEGSRVAENQANTSLELESYYPLTGRICRKGSELQLLGRTLLVLVSLDKQRGWFTPEEVYSRVKRSNLTLEEYIAFLQRASSVGGFFNSSSRLHPDTGKIEHKFMPTACLIIE